MKFAVQPKVSVEYTEKIVSADAGLFGRWVAMIDGGDPECVVVESFFGMFMVYETTKEKVEDLLRDGRRSPTWVEPQKMAWAFFKRLNEEYGLSRAALFEAVGTFRSAHQKPEFVAV